MEDLHKKKTLKELKKKSTSRTKTKCTHHAEWPIGEYCECIYVFVPLMLKKKVPGPRVFYFIQFNVSQVISLRSYNNVRECEICVHDHLA